MIYNENNIILNLRVTDLEIEKIVFSDYFGSIEELNKFLEFNTIEEPLYPETVIDVCKIENDSEIVLLFSYELTLTSPLDEDELEDFYEELKEYATPIVAELTPEIEVAQTVCCNENTKSKQSLSNYKYVCPYCWNDIQNCECPAYPYFLVQIDVGIVEIIKTLNLKGYHTTATCEGHLEDNQPCFYINFKENYKFDLPNGFYWDDNNVRCKYQGQTIEEKTCYKREKLGIFAQMVDKLPSLATEQFK